MSEPVPTIPAAATPGLAAPPPAPASMSSRAAWLGWTLGVLAFLVLAIAIALLWRRPTGADPGQVAILEGRISRLQGAVAALAARPPAVPIDLAPLQARIAALEQRPAATTDPATATALSDLAARLAQDEAGLARMRALDAAAAALAAGRPLGPLTGAPPALARFAVIAPPTAAALRLTYPAAAARAAAASRSAGGGGFVARAWDRMAALVTVRRGTQVLLGPPAAPALATARARLDAGDLAGAVTALGALDPAAAKAMAPWLDQARALIAARVALASLRTAPASP